MEDEIGDRTDIECVLFLEKYIENPCGVFVDGKFEDIMEFYLREAEREIPNLTNPFARDYLEGVIRKYSV